MGLLSSQNAISTPVPCKFHSLPTALASSSGPNTRQNRVGVLRRHYHGRLPPSSFILVRHSGPWQSVNAIPIQTAAFVMTP
jgi:hypothetical protein